MSSPASRTEPPLARTRPMIVLHSVVLPMPLRPTTESTPDVKRQIDALQRVRAAVVDVEAAHFEDRPVRSAAQPCPPPRYKLLHLGVGLDLLRLAFLEDAAVVHHRHALDHAQRDVHVVLDDDIADVRRQRGRGSRSTRAAPSATSPAAGSSNRMKRGAPASASAISSWRCWP